MYTLGVYLYCFIISFLASKNVSFVIESNPISGIDSDGLIVLPQCHKVVAHVVVANTLVVVGIIVIVVNLSDHVVSVNSILVPSLDPINVSHIHVGFFVSRTQPYCILVALQCQQLIIHQLQSVPFVVEEICVISVFSDRQIILLQRHLVLLQKSQGIPLFVVVNSFIRVLLNALVKTQYR